MKRLQFLFSVFALAFIHAFVQPLGLSAQTLNDDGTTHTINVDNCCPGQYNELAAGQVQDYTIPAATLQNRITFNLRGGDGGYAKAGANCKSEGGEGATSSAQFVIGTDANELKPGGTIRFIVGKHGNDRSVGGSAYIAGGGGGGTAVLYRPTSSSDWIILAVAGGGGGAFQGNVFGGCVDSQRGQGGRASENGNDGAGTNHGAGGTNGNGGGSGEGGQTDESGGGGGAFGDGGGGGASDGGALGYNNGGWGGVVITDSTNGSGGFGFGGGGSSFGAAGGGGGYSGGGGGGKFDNGGGGGSYVNATYAISSTKTDGNFGEGDSEQGYVNYTFSNYEIVWTGAISQAWNNAGNWSPSQIPQSGDKVSIPNVTNDPVISTTVSIRSLDIKENAKLEILNVGTLNVNNAPGIGIRVRGELKSNGAININNTGATAMHIAGSGGNAHAILYGDMNIGNSGNINGDGIQVEDQLTIDNDPVYHFDMTPTVKIDNVSGNGISCLGCTLNIKESGPGLFTPVTMVKIGTSGTVGNVGIANAGDFRLYAGIITIGSTVSDGVVNTSISGINYIGDFLVGNGREMNIGSASSPVGGDGIDTRAGATFTTSGTINIRKTAGEGILSAGTFTQNSPGTMVIDQTTSRGIYAVSGSSFTNSGDIKIGGIAATTGNGLVNQGTFINQSGGNIYLDLAGPWKLYQTAFGSFTNNGNIEIGSVTQGTGKGIVNLSTFTNSVTGTISIDQITEEGIVNAGTTFSNSGSINIGENGPVGEYAILQQSGLFNNVDNCNAIIRVFSGGVAGASNFYNNGLILQESAANSTIDQNNNFFIYDAGTVTVLHGNAPVYAENGIPGNCFFTGCSDNIWNNATNWYPQIPTSTEGVVILPGRNVNISNSTTASSKFLYVENGSLVSNYGNLTISNGNFWIKTGGIAQGDGTFTINGDFINDGLFTPHTSTVIMTGSTTNIFQNVFNFYNLTINKPGVTYTLSHDIHLVVENNFVLTAGTFIIHNSANGTSLSAKNLTVNNGAIFEVRDLVTISEDFLIQSGGTSMGGGNYHLGGDFTNLGTLELGTGYFWLEGTANTALIGNQMRFGELHINKTAGAEVILNRNIEVNLNLEMVSGNVNLNGYDIELRSSSNIINERASSYIYGSPGVIKKTLSLNNPNNVNPGNIGVRITSNKNLGNTTIKRGHAAQNVNGQTSILRYYEISPTTNSGLNATVRFSYLDHELNAAEELGLFPFQFNGSNWVKLTANARDASANWVETTNVGSFSKWTLASCSLSFYADSDGDGYGNPLVSINDCSAPSGYVADNTDCDDGDANEHPGQTWYIDADGDDYGASATTACNRPVNGFVLSELSGAGTDDCNDDPITGGMTNPAAVEVCDGIDNNCNSMTDEGVQTAYYQDMDMDGFGNPAMTQQACAAPDGYVVDNTDCDDNDANEYPGQIWYIDADGDHYGASATTACNRPVNGFVLSELSGTGTDDCNDDPTTGGMTNPAVAEVCDGIDNNCNSMTDEGVQTAYYQDMDMDGFGNPAMSQEACAVPDGYVVDNTDCDDNDAAKFPGQTWYPDSDNDGYRGGAALIGCERPDGYKTADELINTTDIDCNDGDPTVFMNQTWLEDADDDGYYSGNLLISCNRPAGFKLAAELVNTTDVDCDDGNAAVNPAAIEICNGIDDDCNNLTDTADPGYVDNSPPTVTCTGQATLIFNGESSMLIDGDNSPVDLHIMADDNCGVQSVTLTPNIIYPNQVGQMVPVTITVTDGKGNPATCTSYIEVTGLPSGWSQQPDGVGCDEGSSVAYNTDTNRWTVTSTNCYYASPYTADETAFAQRTLCGNGSITALVTSISGSALGWAGVVMRESNAAGATKAQLMTNLSTFNRQEFRTATNGQAIPQQFLSQNRYWLRIVRTGNQFAMYVSPNGAAWYIVGTQTIVMDNCIVMGLAATNYTANSTVTATFSNVNYTGSNGIQALSGSSTTGIAPDGSQHEADFSVYPNPTSGELNVNLMQYVGMAVRMEVYSLEGKLLQSREINEVQLALEQIDLKGLPSGLYLVKVKSEGLPDVTRRVVLR